MNNNNNNIIRDGQIQQLNPINVSNIDQFGEFKTAPIESVNLTQVNKKLDDILIQIGILRTEIRDIKQFNQLPYPGSQNQIPDRFRNGQIYPSYFPTSHYPGQQMPPYPNQHILYKNNSQF